MTTIERQIGREIWTLECLDTAGPFTVLHPKTRKPAAITLELVRQVNGTAGVVMVIENQDGHGLKMNQWIPAKDDADARRIFDEQVSKIPELERKCR